MIIIEEYIVFLLVIVVFCVTDLIVISEGKKRRLEDVGPKIGSKISNITINSFNKESKDLDVYSAKLLFVEIDCITCMAILNGIEHDVDSYEKLDIVFLSNKENMKEIESEYESIFRKLSVNYVDKEIVEEIINITACPFYMEVEEGIVIEKGFPTLNNLKGK